MTGILAIETSTDACSVAVYVDGKSRELHEIAPRQHNQRLFGMLRELLPDGDLRKHGIELIAYGCGPGSFTGLRIAASAVQGLAYASGLPAVAISTLAVLAQTALRQGQVPEFATLLATLDARVNEVYSAVYTFDEGVATLREGPWVCPPAALTVSGAQPLHAIGNGCQFVDQFSASLKERIRVAVSEQFPAAQDLIPLALAKQARGDTQSPKQVQPVYVRNEISWKKLSEQGQRL